VFGKITNQLLKSNTFKNASPYLRVQNINFFMFLNTFSNEIFSGIFFKNAHFFMFLNTFSNEIFSGIFFKNAHLVCRIARPNVLFMFMFFFFFFPLSFSIHTINQLLDGDHATPFRFISKYNFNHMYINS
jgi:hypothetical protein